MWSRADIQKIYGLDRNYLNRLADGDDPLLKPTKTDNTGRQTCLYDDEAMERLWLIQLLHREMGYTLKKVRSILDDPEFDRTECLSKQIKLLQEKRDYIDKLIDLAIAMNVSGLPPQMIMEHDGMTAQEYVKRFSDKVNNMSADTRNHIDEVLKSSHFNKSVQSLRTLKKNGVSPESQEAMTALESTHEIFSDMFGKGGIKALERVGEMFYGGGVLAKNVDKVMGQGTADYVGTAILTYCKKHKSMEDLS